MTGCDFACFLFSGVDFIGSAEAGSGGISSSAAGSAVSGLAGLVTAGVDSDVVPVLSLTFLVFFFLPTMGACTTFSSALGADSSSLDASPSAFLARS